MPEPLKLACTLLHRDAFYVEDDIGVDGEPIVYVKVKEAEADTAQGAGLSAADARTLFNWLGVWLHTRP